MAKAALLGIPRGDVEEAVLTGHSRRRRNVGAAQWRVELGRMVVVYEHPDGADTTTARVVTVWRAG